MLRNHLKKQPKPKQEPSHSKNRCKYTLEGLYQKRNSNEKSVSNHIKSYGLELGNLLLTGKDSCDGSQARRGRETRRSLLLLLFHLHFRVGGQCDESRHHSLSYQRLIHPLHQQLIGLDRASRDVTEVGRALGQERATPHIDRERKKKKRSKTKRGGETRK